MTIREYNKCVDDHADGVFRFIFKSLRDEEKARDVVQDSFEKMWKTIDNIDGNKAKSYLYSTAYHTMIDLIRREKKKVDFEHVSDQDYASDENYSDLKEILNDAVERLPDVQKSVILLRDYEGYTYEEIGKITGLNESQVKVYIYRARLFLKKYIGSLETVI